MLRSAPRPDLGLGVRTRAAAIAWKTGTSFGFRDAWTAGVIGHFVLVVWVGNFDGSGSPVLVGVQAAAPLFFALTDALLARDNSLAARVPLPPASLTRVAVCAASGDLPNADCPEQRSTWYIPGVSPLRVSSIHRRVWFDRRSGVPQCPPFNTQRMRSDVYEYWPSELAQSFALAGMLRRAPPPEAQCQSSGVAGSAPRISSPVVGVTYALRPLRRGDDTLPLSANAEAGVQTLYWFADAAYLGESRPGVALGWQPQRSGRYSLRAVDDRGRADQRDIQIEFTQ
jgi:penicillin-binding protein 1C